MGQMQGEENVLKGGSACSEGHIGGQGNVSRGPHTCMSRKYTLYLLQCRAQLAIRHQQEGDPEYHQ